MTLAGTTTPTAFLNEVGSVYGFQQNNHILVSSGGGLNVLRRRWNPRHATRLLDQFLGFRFGQQRHRVASAERGDDGASGLLRGDVIFQLSSGRQSSRVTGSATACSPNGRNGRRSGSRSARLPVERAVEFNSGKFVVNVAGLSGADYTGFAAVDFSKMFLT